jgi:hypothetical protein
MFRISHEIFPFPLLAPAQEIARPEEHHARPDCLKADMPEPFLAGGHRHLRFRYSC